MVLLENGYALSFPKGMSFTDDELFAFCQVNPDLNVERNGDNQLFIMSPTRNFIWFLSFESNL